MNLISKLSLGNKPKQVQLGLLTAAYDGSRLAPVMNLVALSALGIMAYRETGATPALIAWLFLFLGLSVFRQIDLLLGTRRLRSFNPNSTGSFELKVLERKFFFHSSAVGLLWFFFLMQLAPYQGPMSIVLVSLIAAGLAAGSTVTQAPLPLAAFSYMLPLIVGTAAYFYLHDVSYAQILIGLCACYACFLCFGLIRAFDNNLSALERTHQVEKLAEELQSQKEKMSEVNLQLNMALGEAQQASSEKSKFVANMSHEIRTPLNGIIGMASLALEARTEEERSESLHLIRDSAEHLLGLLSDILDFSKIEARKLELVKENFSPLDVIERAVSLVTAIARTKGVTIALKREGELPKVLLGDPTRFGQILLNFMNNAVKFSRDQSCIVVQASSVSEKSGGHLIRVEVSDTGYGISEKDIERIFDEFSQVDDSLSRGHGGVGLGLTISKNLALLMGGKIEVSSRMGKGSTFTVELPFKEGNLLDEEAGVDISLEPMRVLLAEDNVINTKVIENTLTRRGHEVVTAGNGSEAVEYFSAERFDLILMDLQMPLVDGYEATRMIREIESRTERVPTPIIALTAHATTDHRQMSIEAGMDDFITKPISPDKLLAACSRLLKTKE